MSYGKAGLILNVPASATILEGENVSPLPDPQAAVRAALETPDRNCVII